MVETQAVVYNTTIVKTFGTVHNCEGTLTTHDK